MENEINKIDVAVTPITVYSPESQIRHPIRLVRNMFSDLISGRELAWRLAVRDISAQYRQTALGILWAFIMPLANTLIWIFLSKSGIVTIRDTALPYPVYVFTGTLLWATFIDSVNAPLQHTNTARQMLSKINFQREAIVLSGIYQTLFNGVIRIIVLFPFLLLLKIYPGWTLVFFPIGILSLILIGTVIGLFITPVGMLYTDIGRGISLTMQFLMYLCPVVLPMPVEGWAVTLFKLNPLTYIILTTRDWLTGFPADYLAPFLLINFTAFFLMFIAWIIYRAAMPILIERMSA
jgi:lipopolysaccharide transport system permease protein